MSSVDSCSVISEVLIELRKDSTVEASSMAKFMTVCSALSLHDLVHVTEANGMEVKIQLACEKARLATWFIPRRANENPAQVILRYMAEADLVQRGVLGGPFGVEASFTVPSLNVFIQSAKQMLKKNPDDKMTLLAASLALVFLLTSKTDATAESYIASLASETQLPQLDLLCSLLREPMQSHGLETKFLAKSLASFKAIYKA